MGPIERYVRRIRVSHVKLGHSLFLLIVRTALAGVGARVWVVGFVDVDWVLGQEMLDVFVLESGCVVGEQPV